MSEKMQPKLDDLQKKIEEIQQVTEKYKTLLEEKIASKPLESTVLVLAGGALLGILIGILISKRS
jgi:F0F1-type ATP synthase assembly protein I